MGEITVVLGAQWGDEGKGKWIDHLAASVHLVARFQGGSNAGHTLYVDGKKIVLHQLPSAICHPEKTSCILGGVVLDPLALQQEFAELYQVTSIRPQNLLISPRAHVITPFHRYLDGRAEAERLNPIGTTKRGIGPTYASKYNRSGLRVADYIDEDLFRAWQKEMSRSCSEFVTFCRRETDEWEAFRSAAGLIRPLVAPVESIIRSRLHDGAGLLLEGAQGSLLDIDHGTYPYVTSSNTIASAAAVSLGIDPRKISRIYGIAKAYVTRVGGGAFPSELHNSIGDTLVEKGAEYGATTKRRRRCGWFDAVAMRYAAEINGLDGLFVNKVDILSEISPLNIVTAYRLPDGRVLKEFPSDHRVLAQCQPQVLAYDGWDQDISGVRRKTGLPLAARRYIEALSQHSGVPITMVGTGPNREEFIPWH